MENIEQQALITFKKNLAYFETSHRTVFNKINLLNTLIEEGQYAEKYTLEYKNEGYFDVFELSSGQYLYNENSIESSKRVINIYNLQRTGGVFKAQKYVDATDEQAELVDNSDLTFHNALWATIKIINYTKKYAHDKTHMIRSNKAIFLGLGLGLYVQEIVEKLNSRVLFIKEPNLELFRLSLFVTDYEKAFKGCIIFFAITDDETEEREIFIEFLNTGNNYNLNIKHIPFTSDYRNELQRLQSHVLSQSYINYGYSAILLRYINSPRYLVQNYAFMNIMKRYHGVEGNLLSQKPVLMVFSGPSTSKNIEWLREYNKRFIIVSPLSACRLLHSNGIKPNIVIHIDPGAEHTEKLFDGLDVKDYFKDVITILASNVDEKTMCQFNKNNIYFIEQGTEYKKGFGCFSSPSVGEYTFGLMLILGISNMYMLGLDLALDVETMQTHGEYHPFQRTGKINNNSSSMDPYSTVFYVKGNFIDKVPTLPGYKLSIEQASLFTQYLKKDHHKVFNLSNGAYLEGSTPLHIENYSWEEFEILERNDIQNKMTSFFSAISEAKFNTEDRALMRYQINEAKKLEKIIKTFQKKKYVNPEAYLETLAKLAWELSDMENKSGSNLAQVYYEYFQIILSYIYDLFNTKELENPNKHVIKINAILITQLLKISNLYIAKLESYLK